MDVVGVSPSETGSRRPAGLLARSGWWIPALAGAASFWLANLVVSMTSVAAGYRSALSIPYVPMLVEAAAGGLVLAGAVALVLARYPQRVPGAGPLRKALLLALAAVVLLTVLVEVPSKLRSDLAEPGYWLAVATVFNAIRILALGVTIGLLTRARGPDETVTAR
ncbi:MAG: hypothetical protein ACOYBY_01550 [Dermatophilaceae bacterium]